MLTWFIRYKNGKEIANSKEFTYENIDRNELDAFIIVDTVTDMPIITVHFDDNRKKLIYRRRTELPDTTRSFPLVCHVLGWHMNVKGESVQNINYVYETIGRVNKDGIQQDAVWIESAGGWDRQRNSWFYTPKIR